MPILKTVDLEDSKFVLSDYQILKTAGLAGLEGLPNLLLQQVEGLADFGEIYGLKSVRFAGAKSWNSLPVIIRESQSIQVFKSKTKAHFFATRY